MPEDQGLSLNGDSGQDIGAEKDVISNNSEEIVIDRITAVSIRVPMEVNNEKVKAVIVTVLNEDIFSAFQKQAPVLTSSEFILYGCGQNQELLDTRYSMIQSVVENKRKIMVAQTLVGLFTKTIPVRLINLESEPIHLEKNCLLGELHPVNYIEDMFEMDNRVQTETHDHLKLCKTHDLSRESYNFPLPETLEKPNILENSDSDEHLARLDEVFQRLIKAGLCDLMKSEILYLGHIVGTDGIKPNPKLIENVKNWKVDERSSEVPGPLSHTQPEWLAKYSAKDMQSSQKEDTDLKYLHQWKIEEKLLDRETCASLSPAVRRYWLNWENIEMIDVLFIRNRPIPRIIKSFTIACSSNIKERYFDHEP
ncbi:unnamed protein product [Mytilus coruscus]|uniref:Uncharacterized protein n=1 Tax=Mytilus coruscus TaxID=42192 RepID=A0A6J8CSM8_MYTCO|nr:unnamed protein product [Mytilus coruscus]